MPSTDLSRTGLAAWLLGLRAHTRRLELGAPESPSEHVSPPQSYIRRYLVRFAQRRSVRDPRMRLCETLPLGGRGSLALVECDGRRFLAGLSASGVETLLAMDGPGQGTQEAGQ